MFSYGWLLTTCLLLPACGSVISTGEEGPHDSLEISYKEFKKENPIGALFHGRVLSYVELKGSCFLASGYCGKLRFRIDKVYWIGEGFSKTDAKLLAFGPLRDYFREMVKPKPERVKPGDTMQISISRSPTSLKKIFAKGRQKTIGVVATPSIPDLRTVWVKDKCQFDLVEARKRKGYPRILYYDLQKLYKY